MSQYHRPYDGRTELRKAGLRRRADAEKLLETGNDLHARAAGYLGGYAVECKLKAIAMEIHDCWELNALARKWRLEPRDVYTHGLEVFARRLPLWRRLQQSSVWPDFQVCNQWSPAWRYDPRPWSCSKAEYFLLAVKRVVDWLDSNR